MHGFCIFLVHNQLMLAKMDSFISMPDHDYFESLSVTYNLALGHEYIL